MSAQRCYCLTNHHGALEMREGPIPVPKDGEVLVKVSGAGVCHSHRHIWEGFYDLGGGKKIALKDRGIALPMTLGHEIAGEIVKAVTATSLALKGDGTHVVPLDAAIETMRQTGRDMHERYKETSLGGLAVNVVAC